MVEKIIDLSVKNRFIVIFITLLLAFGSIYAIKNTSLDVNVSNSFLDKSFLQKSETLEHSFQKYLNSVYTFI